jgi:hypothetical protein
MKLLFDLFPVILFFATFKYSEKNPEAAAGWMNALLGGAVDLKQAPILIATVRSSADRSAPRRRAPDRPDPPNTYSKALKIIVDFLPALSFPGASRLHRCHPKAVSR